MQNGVDRPSPFLELRRKVLAAELLSAATERLLLDSGFSGRLSLVVQNGRVLKCGYEEGYFSRRTLLADPAPARSERPDP